MFPTEYELAGQGSVDADAWLEHCTLTLLRHEEYLTCLRIHEPGTGVEWDAARAPLTCPAACLRLERDLRIPLDPAWAILPVAFIRSAEGPMIVYPRVPNLRETLMPGTFTLSRFLAVATQAARALASAHACGVIHGNLTPEHIAVSPEGARLNGFMSIDDTAPPASAFAPSHWPYLAPEQLNSERASREVRSDLYSLAVVLYEVLAGRLPLEGETLVQWLHVHAAVQPMSPSELDPQVPAVVSSILLKCLAKDPGERYQKAEALAADLAHCCEQLARHGRIEPFETGLLDKTFQWSRSARLVGREAEQRQLSATYAQVVETGLSAVAVVCGSPGEGKSTLVQHWLSSVSPDYWARGRSRSLQREIPYAPFRQILASLARFLSARSFDEVERFKASLSRQLGSRGRLLTDLCPAFEAILGPTSEQPSVPAYHAILRANQTLLDTLAVFGSFGTPLVIFFDDVQWADDSTLSLLRAFLDAPPTNVFLILAHRASAASRLSAPDGLLHGVHGKSIVVENIALGPFPVEAVAQLLARYLNMRAQDVAEIAVLVHSKTAGNPFFIVQILRALIDDKLLRFDAQHRKWTWALEDVARHRYADNVADLMVHRLNRLPEIERDLMRLASGVGVKVDEGLLRELSGLGDIEFVKVMKALVDAGLLMYEGQSLIFPHDRIHEAAYGLTPLEVRPAVHGRIAQLMVQRAHTVHEKSVFEIANQIQRSIADLCPDGSYQPFIGVLIDAARLAKSAGAVKQACDYLVSAQVLLEATPQPDPQRQAFCARWLAAECNLLLADLDSAEALIGQCFADAITALEQASTYRLMATLKTLRSDHEGAIAAALAGLQLLQTPLIRKPDEQELNDIYQRIRALIGQRSIPELAALPQMNQPDTEAAMELLSTLISSFFTHDGMGFLHLAKMVELTLLHGTSPASCYGLAWFGVMIASRYDEYVDGHAFVQLALDIGEQRGYEASRTSTLLAMDQVSPWTLPLAFAREQASKAFEIGSRGGDLVMACYAVTHLGADMFVMGEPLSSVLEELERGLTFIRKFDYFDVERIVEAQKQFATDMQVGRASQVLAPHDPSQALSAPARFWTLLYSGMSACLLGEAEFAIRQFEAAAPSLWSVAAHINVSTFYLFYSLALGSPQAPGSVESRLALLSKHRSHFALWAKLNPATFRHKLLLIDGLIARLEGQDIVAIRNFDQAGIAAAATGFIHEQAIAHEQLAQTCVLTGLVSGANLHLRVSRDCYRLWGAAAKAAQMEREHTFLSIDTVVERSMSTILQEKLDMEAGMGAAKAVSEEVHLDRLVETLMTQVILYAGADRGVLVTVDGASLKIAVSARLEGGAVISSAQGCDAAFDEVPMSVLYATIRASRPLVIDDASRQCPMAHRADFANRMTRSVLCLPLIRQGTLLALLYLENRQVPRLFDQKKLAMLELLASQAAVSLHTARIYAHALEESRLRAKTEIELSTSQAELARSSHLAVLGELAASIAHEISQPLLSILTNSAASLRWLSRETPNVEEARAGLQDISADGERATSILRAVRSLASQAPIQIAELSVNDIVRDVLRLLLPRISGLGVRVELDLSARERVFGDQVQVQQLLFNLITNALDAMASHREQGRLLMIRTACDGKWLHASVEDNGPGIAAENLEKIFDPFFTTKGSGMGMGLAICRSILDAHAGRLTVESSGQTGCRMRFRLPVRGIE